MLVTPEVHWNTGNIGRTCLGAEACLHLIRPLGFSLDSRQVKRAGLDYWPMVRLRVWDSFAHFQDGMAPAPNEVALFSKTGPHPFWALRPPERLFMIFGAETKGLPTAVLAAYPQRIYHIPIAQTIRSLNLSTAVGIVLYESLRETGFRHGY